MIDSPISMNASVGRIAQLAREKDEKRAQERRRSLVYLIAAFLEEQGYKNSLDAFSKEARLSRDYQICDNIDLETILLEYVNYFYARFNKYPKICKKVDVSNVAATNNTDNKRDKIYKNNVKSDEENSTTKCKISSKSNNETLVSQQNFGVMVTPIFPSLRNEPDMIFDEKKELKTGTGLYPPLSELQTIADAISQEIVLKDLNVHWNDIIGLEGCKTLLKEATVYPIKYSTLFSKKFSSWKGILLYGPPGTGKTMLAKAVATECQVTFFNITSSSLISKWRGDSEKYVRVLIDLARYHAPTIIFIDEIDWTTAETYDCSSKSSEPARRFRAELLTRLDGLLSEHNVNIILLAATNMPWNIDAALLRRLEKRIYVDLPNKVSRLAILQSHVQKDLEECTELHDIVEQTEGYSCADLKLLCKEAWMKQMQPIWKSLEEKKTLLHNVECSGLITKTIYLREAMNYIKPIVKHMKAQYVQWNKTFGFFDENSDKQNIKNAENNQTANVANSSSTNTRYVL